MKWNHDDLADDLAEYLQQNSDNIIWVDMQLGPSGSPRPDVYKIPKSYSGFKPIAYECKVSVADFRSDITKGKWQSYLTYASGVIFAVPQGLITKDDVPKGCGLIVRSDSGWRVMKSPTLLPVKDKLPVDYWIKLVIDGVHRSKRQDLIKKINTYKVQSVISQKYGEELGAALSRRDQARAVLDKKTAYLQEKTAALDIFRQADYIRRQQEEIVEQRKEICGLLGLSATASTWDIQKAIDNRIKMLSSDVFIQEVKRTLGHALRDVRNISSNLEDFQELLKQESTKVV